jgi:alcohol dehydrogenase class IV
VLDFNRVAVPDRIAEIARELGVRGNDESTLSFECAGAVRALRESIGLPSNLHSQGVKEKDLPRLAALAFADPCHQLNPRRCTEDDLLALYKASFGDD